MSDDEAVAAHLQKSTHSYVVRYPAHPARTSDPHYKDFDHIQRVWKKDPEKWRCSFGAHRNDFSECDLTKPLEIHHAHIEFALQNGVDLKWLEVDYPGVGDPTTVGAWVESAENLVVLCVLPDTPVLMADGTWRAVQDVRLGDRVIGGDGAVDIVTGTIAKPYSGYAFRSGAVALTMTHGILTTDGWRAVGQVANEVGVGRSDVVGLAGIQHEVCGSVVGSVAVDVVNALVRQEWSPKNLLGNEAMLHYSTGAFRVENADITRRGEVARALSSIGSRKPIQGLQTTRVATELSPSMWQNLESRSTDFTASLLSLQASHGSSSHGAAFFGTGGDFVGVNDGSREIGSTDATRFDGSVYGGAAIRGAVNGVHSDTLTYEHQAMQVRWQKHRSTGTVYDLETARTHSFVAGGLVVHNCVFHHRGHGGVHVATVADYEAAKYVRNLIER